MDVLFAAGRVANQVFSVLRKRSRTDAQDAKVVLRAAFDNPLLMPFARAWLDGARAIPVVLHEPSGDKLAGVLVTEAPLVVRNEPLEESILAAVRSIEGVALARRRGDVLIESSEVPIEMVRLTMRQRG